MDMRSLCMSSTETTTDLHYHVPRHSDDFLHLPLASQARLAAARYLSHWYWPSDPEITLVHQQPVSVSNGFGANREQVLQ